MKLTLGSECACGKTVAVAAAEDEGGYMFPTYICIPCCRRLGAFAAKHDAAKAKRKAKRKATP